jgi:hypothetical protein
MSDNGYYNWVGVGFTDDDIMYKYELPDEINIPEGTRVYESESDLRKEKLKLLL